MRDTIHEMQLLVEYAPFFLPYLVGRRGRGTLTLSLVMLLAISSSGWDPWKFLALASISFLVTLGFRANLLRFDHTWVLTKVMGMMLDTSDYLEGVRIVKYKHGGKEWKVYLPTDISCIRRMSESRVYLVKEGQRIDITQEPGVLYLACAKDLGGDSIVVVTPDGERDLGPDGIVYKGINFM